MTDTADKQLLPFHVWRNVIFKTPASKQFCEAPVWDGSGFHSHQCSRKPKHQYGGHGWCAQHFPPNEHSRKEARSAACRAEAEDNQKRWAREAAERRQKDAALDAIKQIAAGHNDPRALAREVLAMIPSPTP